MIPAVVAAVVAVAGIIYFVVRFVKTPLTPECVVYMPKWMFFFGMAMYVIGAVFLIVLCAEKKWFQAIPGIGFMIFGAIAMACQLNQRAVKLTDGTYVYSTMFGKKKHFSADDRIGMRYNSDSVTVFLKNGKIHIESLAQISDDFRKNFLSDDKN